MEADGGGMSLNKVSKNGNMYDWITNTYNPLGGVCPHMCHYCYAQNFRFPSLKEKYSGLPRLYENELKRNLGKNKFWFVGSCIDLFAESIPVEWIHKTLDHCRQYESNRYLFQSKNPDRIYTLRRFLPPDVVVGTTIETNRYYRKMGRAPSVAERAWNILQLSLLDIKTIITVEPIMDFDVDKLVGIIKAAEPTWVNIGANTNSKVKLPEPSPGKVKDLIEELSVFTEVKVKSNLKRLMS